MKKIWGCGEWVYRVWQCWSQTNLDDLGDIVEGHEPDIQRLAEVDG
jgi:hypothetical protein